MVNGLYKPTYNWGATTYNYGSHAMLFAVSWDSPWILRLVLNTTKGLAG